MSDCRARPGSLWPGKLCDCSECRPLRLRTMKHHQYRGLRVTGRDEARARVEEYLRAGWSVNHVATLAGLSGSGLTKMVERPEHRLAQASVLAILRLPPDPPSIIGAQRRLRALARIGWGLGDIRSLTGIPQTTLYEIRSDGRTRMEQRTLGRLTAIADVYDTLSMQLAPEDRFHNKTRRLAERCGWPPPLAWDDDIDDPDAKPHMPKGERRGNPGADLPSIEQIVAEVNRGSPAGVAAHYRVNQRTIERRLSSAGYRARRVGAHAYVYAKEDAA